MGYVLNPLRKPAVIERWSPFEISVFEGSIALYGKHFHTIQKIIKTKTVKECIEFYYYWKKTYVPDDREVMPTLMGKESE